MYLVPDACSPVMNYFCTQILSDWAGQIMHSVQFLLGSLLLK